MNKDFSRHILLSFNEKKQIKAIYDLACYISKNSISCECRHFEKLRKYHSYLSSSDFESVQKLNKEFAKVKELNYQFEVYLMNLERLLGQSSDDYQIRQIKNDKKDPLSRNNIICILDSIRSAHNVGAMIRNAECFGNKKIILSGLSPKHTSKQVKKTAMGCEKMIECLYYNELEQKVLEFKNQGYKVLAVEKTTDSVALESINITEDKYLLMFGHEVYGVSQQLLHLSDMIVHINLSGQKNSLNVAIAQGITLNYIHSQIRFHHE